MPRANSARTLAARAKGWIDEAMAMREGLSPEARRDAAEPHLALAKDCLTDEHADALMSVIGRHAWTARILMAED